MTYSLFRSLPAVLAMSSALAVAAPMAAQDTEAEYRVPSQELAALVGYRVDLLPILLDGAGITHLL